MAFLVRMLALLLVGAVVAAILPILLGGLFVGAVVLHDAITTKNYIGPEYYQYTYAMIEDWNKNSLGTDREDMANTSTILTCSCFPGKHLRRWMNTISTGCSRLTWTIMASISPVN